MTQLSQKRRSRILPPKPMQDEERARRRQRSDELAMRCNVIFERLRPQLIETHYNWHIAIDPDTEQYIIDPTLNGITEKIVEAYGYTSEPKLTIFRLNDTGCCGKI
ncbi:MAG: hypothetical protein KME29_36490 [Calothrix sp. FI2-JRJ7]|nr:hypothetical protein [Calothrix sp. FI2-JRJ7]